MFHREKGTKPDVLERVVIAAPVVLDGTSHVLAVSIHRKPDGFWHYDLTRDNSADDKRFSIEEEISESPGDGVPGEAASRSMRGTGSLGQSAAEGASAVFGERDLPAAHGSQSSLPSPFPGTDLNLFKRPTEIKDQAAPATEPALRISPAQAEEIREIVRQVAGIDPALPDRIEIPEIHPGRDQWGGGYSDDLPEVEGFYNPVNDVVAVSMAALMAHALPVTKPSTVFRIAS